MVHNLHINAIKHNFKRGMQVIKNKFKMVFNDKNNKYSIKRLTNGSRKIPKYLKIDVSPKEDKYLPTKTIKIIT